jgi:hypothetical protein
MSVIITYNHYQEARTFIFGDFFIIDKYEFLLDEDFESEFCNVVQGPEWVKSK